MQEKELSSKDNKIFFISPAKIGAFVCACVIMVVISNGNLEDAMTQTISIKRLEQDLDGLHAIGQTDAGGSTRLPFTDTDQTARNYLVSLMEEAGLTVRIDAIGSVIGRLEGKSPKTILVGSHYDSVCDGGKYDGAYGVMAGIEIGRALAQNQQAMDYSYEVIAFNDEEGVRFGSGFLGSLSFVGGFDHDKLFTMADDNGITIAEAMTAQGFDPNRIKSALAPLDTIITYLEIHVEQGPVLDTKGLDMGIVTSIVGQQRYTFEINGRADHAGTTPMNMRADALIVAAKAVLAAQNLATAFDPDGVATVGSLRVLPSSSNVVPKKVEFSLDIRSKDSCSIHRVLEGVLAVIEEACGKDLSFRFYKTIGEEPRLMDAKLQALFEKHIVNRGYSYTKLPSGAGHDALIMADVVPTAMLFVPSKDGRSHSPQEYTPSANLLMGTEVLYDVVAELLTRTPE